MFKTIVSILAVFILSTSLFAENGDISKEALLSKIVEAYGGEAALTRALGYIQHWRVIRSSDGVEGEETRRVTLPERLYVNLKYPDKEEARVLEGDVGIKIFDKRVKKQAFGPMLDAMKLQLLRIYNPLVLEKFSDRIEMVSQQNGYILKLSGNGVECDYYVDPKNFRIEKTVGKLKIGPTDMEFVTLYKDFTRYGSVLMPSKEIKYAGGVQTAVNKLLDMEFFTLKRVSDHRYERI